MYRRGCAYVRDAGAWGGRDGLERSRHLGAESQVLTVHFRWLGAVRGWSDSRCEGGSVH